MTARLPIKRLKAIIKEAYPKTTEIELLRNYKFFRKCYYDEMDFWQKRRLQKKIESTNDLDKRLIISLLSGHPYRSLYSLEEWAYDPFAEDEGMKEFNQVNSSPTISLSEGFGYIGDKLPREIKGTEIEEQNTAKWAEAIFKIFEEVDKLR